MASVNPSAAFEAAKIAGESSEMDITAHKLRELAKADSQKHRDSGEFGDSIVVQKVRGKKGVNDRLVVATDPLGAIKEFGHVIRHEKGGPELGYVPGQHSMQNAYKQIAEVSGD